MDSDHDPDGVSVFVSAVSALLWLLEVRALAALYKSDDEEQALRIIRSEFLQPLHRRAADRVSEAWGRSHNQGRTLADALVALEDEEAWSFRVQLPTAVSELTGIEHRARGAVAELWKEIAHG